MNTTSVTPQKAKSGASAPTSSAMSWPVMVVPTFAPMMIHTACRRVIMPELTKPTTMTVVAEEDWITAVMPAPTATPSRRLLVNRSKIRFMRLPAAASSPELIICIPYKNSARPPRSPRISATFTRGTLLLSLLPSRIRRQGGDETFQRHGARPAPDAGHASLVPVSGRMLRTAQPLPCGTSPPFHRDSQPIIKDRAGEHKGSAANFTQILHGGERGPAGTVVRPRGASC